MKDIHGERATPGRIPIISPTLHIVAMSALVFLRTSFGFTLFRPRSIFFALSFATAVSSYIAWNEPAIWREFMSLCIYAMLAVVLYWLHFTITLFRELYRSGERDDYSGTSHVLRILGMLQQLTSTIELNVQLWIEPAIVLIASLLFRHAFHESHLSGWLLFVTPCMFCKELMNHWAAIRREKIAGDITAEAAERGDALSDERATPEAPRATRVSGQKLSRHRARDNQSLTQENEKQS